MTASLPEAHRAAVQRALQTAFGTAEMDSIIPLTGGLSGALVFRIRVGGVPYLLRVDGATDAVRDPRRWHECMKIAAEACLAPPVRHASADDGVAILDFIPERSITLDYSGDREDLLNELGQTVRILHQCAPFPPLMDYLDAVDMLVAQFRGSGVAEPGAIEAPLRRYAEVAAVYRRLPRELVSSHNDLNPRNILYDGRRLWLVDWESSFLADRYVDLAAIVTFFATTAGEAETVLRAYFGSELGDAQRARLSLARQISHVFYGIMFLSGAAERPGAPLTPPRGGRSLAALHAALGLGQPVFETSEGRAEYGWAHFAEAAGASRGGETAAALAAPGA